MLQLIKILIRIEVYKLKLLFVHETKIKQDNEGNYYTTGSYDENIWERYLNLSSDLTLISRKEKNIYDTEFASNNFNKLDKNKVKFVEIPDLNASIKNYTSIKLRKEKNRVVDTLVEKSDFVIARLPSESGYRAVKKAKSLSKPYIVEVVGCPWDALWNYSLKGKMLAPIAYLKLKKYVKNAAYVIYVTNEFLQKRYPNNFYNIGCSDVRLLEITSKTVESRMKKIENTKIENGIVLGTVAAVDVKYKGQEYVIKAIANLKKRGYKFKYLLAGSGDSTYLKKIAENHDVSDEVVFVGSIPHELIFDYLDNIDLYIQPSKQEGLPRALLEAMSRGCPSLGAKTGGMPELLNDELTFRKGDSGEIERILINIDKDILIKESMRSFNKAKEYNTQFLDNKRLDFYTKFKKDNGL